MNFLTYIKANFDTIYTGMTVILKSECTYGKNVLLPRTINSQFWAVLSFLHENI